jgi:hypothetical protein
MPLVHLGHRRHKAARNKLMSQDMRPRNRQIYIPIAAVALGDATV